MPAEALTQLRSAFVKIGDIVRCIGELHAATRLQKVDLPALDLRLFVSRPRLGRTLLSAGLEHLAATGSTSVHLYVEAANTRAVELYDRAGFAVVHSDVLYGPPPEPSQEP